MKRIILLSTLIVLSLVSCQNDKSKPFDDFEVTENGLMYKFYLENEGDTPNYGDLLDIRVMCNINDTAVIIPNVSVLWQMFDPLFSGDIYEGISMMHKGDSASFIVRADSTFMTLFRIPMPSEFSVNDMMRFDIKLNDFYPESELLLKYIDNMKQTFPEETKNAEEELKQYLKDNNIKASPTETGLYYQKIKDGNGERPLPGTMVKVHYTGKLLDGTVFDSSVVRKEPFQFVLGIGQVISGWDEGLQLMSKGEKGVLYIPYYLAYGDKGLEPIPPFATLKFEVELLDF